MVRLEPWQEELLRLQAIANKQLIEITRADLELKHMQVKIQALDQEINFLENASEPLTVSVQSIFSPHREEGEIL